MFCRFLTLRDETLKRIIYLFLKEWCSYFPPSLQVHFVAELLNTNFQATWQVSQFSLWRSTFVFGSFQWIEFLWNFSTRFHISFHKLRIPFVVRNFLQKVGTTVCCWLRTGINPRLKVEFITHIVLEICAPFCSAHIFLFKCVSSYCLWFLFSANITIDNAAESRETFFRVIH